MDRATEMPQGPGFHEGVRPKDTPLFQETQAFLRELGVSATPSEALTQYLAPRIFDRGMAEPLVVDGRKFAPVPVFASGMAEQLRALGYNSLFVGDIDDMYSANQASHANGDRLLREVAGKLHEHFRASKIMRLGGDEFVVWFRSGSRADLERLNTQKIAAEEDIEKNVSVSYKKGGVIAEGKASINLKVDAIHLVNTIIKDRPPYHQDPNRPAIALSVLRALHPELTPVIEEISGWEDAASQQAMALVLENTLYDHILQPLLQDRITTGEESETIKAFKDAVDFMQHAGVRERNLMKVEFPGVLKLMNARDYTKGNEFIKAAFEQLILAMGGEGVHDVGCFRRGSDFYISYNLEGQDKEHEVRLARAITEIFAEREELVSEVSIPISPVVAFAKLSPNASEADVKESMNIVDDATKQETYKFMYDKLHSDDVRQLDHVSQYYNPADKRGEARLRELGADDKLIEDLRASRVDFIAKLQELLGRKVSSINPVN